MHHARTRRTLRILYIGKGGLSDCFSLSCNSHTSLPCGPSKLHDTPSLRLNSRDPTSRVMAVICGRRLERASVCVAQHRTTQLPTPSHQSATAPSPAELGERHFALVMVNDELSFPLCKSFFLIT